MQQIDVTAYTQTVIPTLTLLRVEYQISFLGWSLNKVLALQD